MNNNITITSSNGVDDTYQLGDTVRLVDDDWTWWMEERPFFPVPFQDELAYIQGVQTRGTEITLCLTEPRKIWKMRIL